MLLRIAPDMFADERYECITTRTVHDEIMRTTRFKERYPWRKAYRSNLKTVNPGEVEDDDFRLVLEAVRAVNAQLNPRTGRFYDLSRADQRIAATAIHLKHAVSTCDRNLADLLDRQFDTANVWPLELVNRWLEGNLIEWDDARQEILDDWHRCGEPAQPNSAIAKFEQLTGRSFPDK